MGFPHSVAIKALADCRRCCCICHKFCGSKIELHHIKQRANGGDDSYENCIPLCFNCHADMGKIDPRHPKGHQYSSEELKIHRDNWYHQAQNVCFHLSEDEIHQTDIDLFYKISRIFTQPDLSYWLSTADLAAIHPRDTFNSLQRLIYETDQPFSKFINLEMESLRQVLIDVVEEFLLYKDNNTFIKRIGKDDVCVTRQWIINHENWCPHIDDKNYFVQCQNEAQQLNELASKVWNQYNKFILQGRSLLKL